MENVSTDHNSFSTTDSDDDFFEVAKNDDTDEQMIKMILQQQHMLLGAAQSSFGGSKRRKYVERDRAAAHARLVNDYFTEQPVWTNEVFRRRFRMQRELFLRIVNALESHDEYFHWRVDATSKKAFHHFKNAQLLSLNWHTEALQIIIMSTYGLLKQRPSIACSTFVDRHGFPGMLGSLDCMHWEWKNCPVACKGQFTRGDHGVPTIMHEAVAFADLWIWHAFFGVAGSNNDINVLNQSPLFNDVLQGNAPEINFTVNGTQYTQGYYLTDGVYPEWAAFVKSFPCP
ncbi:uncharacterized protein [Primulina eburnea]|uniref:uncharacterized protein n=1 Tax=Primulina eburnea TaxID=1245227 RepID=UPI003C6C8B96